MLRLGREELAHERSDGLRRLGSHGGEMTLGMAKRRVTDSKGKL
jgi:hypothetical protein